MFDLQIEELCLDFSHFPPFHFPSLGELSQKPFGEKKNVNQRYHALVIQSREGQGQGMDLRANG